MIIPPFEIDFRKAIKTINEKNYKRILLQLPEGLKNHFTKFVVQNRLLIIMFNREGCNLLHLGFRATNTNRNDPFLMEFFSG